MPTHYILISFCVILRGLKGVQCSTQGVQQTPRHHPGWNWGQGICCFALVEWRPLGAPFNSNQWFSSICIKVYGLCELYQTREGVRLVRGDQDVFHIRHVHHLLHPWPVCKLVRLVSWIQERFGVFFLSIFLFCILGECLKSCVK